MYAWLVAPLPRGRGKTIPVLDHICKVRRCCNPLHLRLVSDAENLACSDAPATVNRRKTHCIRGHLLGEAQVVSTTGKRMRTCRICKIAYDEARKKPPRTHCRNGHPFADGQTQCLICRKAASARWYLANKERSVASARASRDRTRDAYNARRRERRASLRNLR